jgi:RNA recognition motif-containing protein
MNIQVYNIGQNVRDADLKKLFATYGIVESAAISRDKLNGRSKGNALIEMPIEKEALQAIAALDQMLIDGKKISVSAHRVPPEW